LRHLSVSLLDWLSNFHCRSIKSLFLSNSKESAVLFIIEGHYGAGGFTL
jgi:hypothetical protein